MGHNIGDNMNLKNITTMKRIFTILTAAASLFAIESAYAATTAHEADNNTIVRNSDVQVETFVVASEDIKYYTYHATKDVEAIITVVGDGSSDIDLYIFDIDANLITDDLGESDVCVCRWVPTATCDYYIAIKNLGSTSNKCTITAQ